MSVLTYIPTDTHHMTYLIALLAVVVFNPAVTVTASIDSRLTSANCTDHWIEQPLDHFTYAQTPLKFNQRYFVCSSFFQPTGGPIFFYTGHEADVTLFVNNTGLMWELAQSVGALLVFAEHRFYGKSLPAVSRDCLQFLTASQALSDYANLISHLYTAMSIPKSATVVTFGSGYGGMLAGWMRIKYPHLVDGAIASSAPIFHPFEVTPPSSGNAFARRVTEVMGPVCATRLKAVLHTLDRWTENETDKKHLQHELGLCRLDNKENVLKWAQSPWGFLAMGNYPYPNAYIPATAGVSTNPLPPNPLNAACAILTRSTDTDDKDLIASLRASLQSWYNGTGAEACFPVSVVDPVAGVHKGQCHGDFSFQRCAELGGPFQQGTKKDAFWPAMTVAESNLHTSCESKYGRAARVGAAAVEFGDSIIDTVAGMSNIIWSNGEFDPWAEYGVDCSQIDCPSSVFSPTIRGGAHSSDLMFSSPLDDGHVTEVRRMEYVHISSWIEAKALRHAGVRHMHLVNDFPNVKVVMA